MPPQEMGNSLSLPALSLKHHFIKGTFATPRAGRERPSVLLAHRARTAEVTAVDLLP